MSRCFYAFILILGLLAFVGCNHAKVQYTREGTSKQELTKMYGHPLSQESLGDDREVWTYRDRNERMCRISLVGGVSIAEPDCRDTDSSRARTEANRRHWSSVAANMGSHSAGEYVLRNNPTNPEPPIPNPTGNCGGLSPMASMGCHKVCINGAWADVCP